jgi:hypothetical protein
VLKLKPEQNGNMIRFLGISCTSDLWCTTQNAAGQNLFYDTKAEDSPLTMKKKIDHEW